MKKKYQFLFFRTLAYFVFFEEEWKDFFFLNSFLQLVQKFKVIDTFIFKLPLYQREVSYSFRSEVKRTIKQTKNNRNLIYNSIFTITVKHLLFLFSFIHHFLFALLPPHFQFFCWNFFFFLLPLLPLLFRAG